MAAVDLQDVHDFLIDIAYVAGKMMLAAHPAMANTDEKKNSADIVTETDQAIEQMVSTRLRARYPSFFFIGEESYQAGVDALTDAPTFIVDPIDGTTNFVHNFPAFCISLGFTVNRVPSVGVIYNALLGNLYTAIKDQGAFMTRQGHDPVRLPLRGKPEPLKDLSGCIMAMELGTNRDLAMLERNMKILLRLAASKKDGGGMVQGVRFMGSAAAQCCHVAAGQLDAYWEEGPMAWDIAAGSCIIEEAGGRMVGALKGDWTPNLEGKKFLFVRGAEKDAQDRLIQEVWDLVGKGQD